jgi:hypothetical protein
MLLAEHEDASPKVKAVLPRIFRRIGAARKNSFINARWVDLQKGVMIKDVMRGQVVGPPHRGRSRQDQSAVHMDRLAGDIGGIFGS